MKIQRKLLYFYYETNFFRDQNCQPNKVVILGMNIKTKR